MPLTVLKHHDPDGRPVATWVRVRKILINSNEKMSEDSSYRYKMRFMVTPALTNVAAIELTGYNIPNNIAPTFYASGLKHRGTDKLDFKLVNTLPGQSPLHDAVFAITWPEKQYTYTNTVATWLSYVDTLAQLMNQAVAGDTYWGPRVLFTPVVDAEERTVIQCDSLDQGVNHDVYTFTFQFETGANAENSAYYQMGFNTGAGADVTSTSVSGQQRITGPFTTKLQPFRYLDVGVEQVQEYSPVKRIFFSNQLYYGTTQNDVNGAVRFLTRPIDQTQYLDVSLWLEGDVAPAALANNTFDLIFTVYELIPENRVPTWVSQQFTL